MEWDGLNLMYASIIFSFRYAPCAYQLGMNENYSKSYTKTNAPYEIFFAIYEIQIICNKMLSRTMGVVQVKDCLIERNSRKCLDFAEGNAFAIEFNIAK